MTYAQSIMRASTCFTSGRTPLKPTGERAHWTSERIPGQVEDHRRTGPSSAPTKSGTGRTSHRQCTACPPTWKARELHAGNVGEILSHRVSELACKVTCLHAHFFISTSAFSIFKYLLSRLLNVKTAAARACNIHRMGPWSCKS
jgi:hypothetical protein